MQLTDDLVWPENYNEVPKEVFVRQDIYELELKRIFYGPEWHVLGHEAEIPNQGDFKTISLAEVPLLMTRGKDDAIRVFYNSCSHRGTQLETAPSGKATRFQCPYHRWTFSNHGELTGCPQSEGFTPGFQKSDFPLSQPRYEIFAGIIFVTLANDAPGLDEFLGGAKEALLASVGGGRPLQLLGYHKARYDCNWKAIIDNDGYHPALLHVALRMIGWASGQGAYDLDPVRGHRMASSEIGNPQNDGFLSDQSLITTPDGADLTRFTGTTLFPACTSAPHFGTTNLRFYIPRGVDKTDIYFAYFGFADDTPEITEHRKRQVSNLLGPGGLISLEDAAMFHRVQIGSQTPGNAVFQKGVRDTKSLPVKAAQNEEGGNAVFWEYYRKVLGFERSKA